MKKQKIKYSISGVFKSKILKVQILNLDFNYDKNN